MENEYKIIRTKFEKEADMDDTLYMYSDLATKVYIRLKEMIISGELPAGQKLLQEELAASLGVSRTPLLQAISRLSQENLVRTVPRRGSFVVSITSNEIIDAFEISCSLEPLAAALMAEHPDAKAEEKLRCNLEEQEKARLESDIARFNELDNEFHKIIISSSGNTYMEGIMHMFSSPIYSKESLLKDMDERFFEHRTIVANIVSHDSKSARSAMEYHKNILQEGKLRQLLEKGEENAAD